MGVVTPIRVIGLMSGGLDSTLAAAIVKEMGAEVLGLHFSTGFCKLDHRRAMAAPGEDPERLGNPALRAGAQLGIPVEVVDVADEYMQIVRQPRYGYGAQVNPCIDCRIFMLRKARAVMEEQGAGLVFTGEVVGQRPMSQYKRALRLIEQKSGLEGRLLRPLSAHLLEPTIPEREGRIDRTHLLAIQGRTRKPQIDLAARFRLPGYEQPSGGCCYLADPNYARRLRDLWTDEEWAMTREDTTLPKVGRHFRLSPRLRLIAGRNEAENRFLERFASGRWSFAAADGAGTFAIALGEPDGGDLPRILRFVARYSRSRGEGKVPIRIRHHGHDDVLASEPASEEELARHRL